MLESRVPFLSFCKKDGLWKATQAGKVLLMTRSASLMSSGVNLWKVAVLVHRDWPRRGTRRMRGLARVTSPGDTRSEAAGRAATPSLGRAALP